MAYYITFYCASRCVDPDEALDRLTADSASQGFSVFTTDRSAGKGWASMSAGSTKEDAASGRTLVEFDVNADVVRESVSQVAAEDVSGRINETDSMLVLTLAGNGMDLPLVRAVWKSASSLWRAIPYDDGSGFEVTEASLG